MNNINRTLLICTGFLLLSAGVAAQSSAQQQKDAYRKQITEADGEEKLKLYSFLTGIYYVEAADEMKRDTLLALYDEMDSEAQRQNNASFRGLIRLNILNVHLNLTLYDEIIKRAPEYLAFCRDNELWRYYALCCKSLSSAYLYKGETDNALAPAKELYEISKKRNDNEGIAIGFYMMADVYHTLGKFREQEDYMRQCIELLKGNEKQYQLLANAWQNLSQSLQAQSRYEEMLLVAAEAEKFYHHYEDKMKIPLPGIWINLYRSYMEAYSELNDLDNAEKYCDKLEELPENIFTRIDICNVRAEIFASRGQYANALEMINRSEALSDAEINAGPKIRKIKMRILSKMGKAEELYDLYLVDVAARDSLRTKEMSAQLNELRTIYEVDKITAAQVRNRNYFLFALAGCLLLAAVLGIYIYYHRKIVRCNRGLYLQIKQQDRLAGELEQLRKQYAAAAATQCIAPLQNNGDPQDEPGNARQRELVARLHDYLRSKRNFANIDIEKDDIVVALATNRSSLSKALKAVTDTTLHDYINDLRLEEARQMLEYNPDLTVEAIAADCGFNTYRTFSRLFQEKYRINPGGYRKAAETK
ncbi:hypothetical protein FACS189452_00180 [Bacteroidia bacterium]|nr:hypothetical protein FACS189452_00180 [Bacteroidia bacterium]GHT80305.1 hypothetical protein FACS189467_2150 [Bacteroidia bacterium]